MLDTQENSVSGGVNNQYYFNQPRRIVVTEIVNHTSTTFPTSSVTKCWGLQKIQLNLKSVKPR